MNYTYDWTCTNNHGNTSSWDIKADELGADTLTNYCEVCGEEHEHLPLTIEMTVYKICEERPTLEDMGILLDSCADMYDLGYVDNTLEQAVMNELAILYFVPVYAIHDWAVNKQNKDHEWLFDNYIVELTENLLNY